MEFNDRIRLALMSCFTVFGCTGNLLTLLIVNREFFRKTASSAFISGLCIADSVVLFLQNLKILTGNHGRLAKHDCALMYFMDVFRLLSVWIVSFINIERCSLVFNPCSLRRITSPIHARCLIIVFLFISIVIFSHYSVNMNMVTNESTNNQTEKFYAYCEFSSNFSMVTWEIIKSSLTYWSSIPLCFISNLIIIIRLVQASRIERTFNQQSYSARYGLSNKQQQLMMMLVASSLCFILTSAPYNIHQVYILLREIHSPFHYKMHTATNVLLQFHHASNFIAFTISCARFRLELVKLFRTYLRCQIYTNWHKRSTPGTDQIFLNSNKQRVPMKLLSPKSNSRQRSGDQAPAQNMLILQSKNTLLQRSSRTKRQTK